MTEVSDLQKAVAEAAGETHEAMKMVADLFKPSDIDALNAIFEGNPRGRELLRKVQELKSETSLEI